MGNYVQGETKAEFVDYQLYAHDTAQFDSYGDPVGDIDTITGQSETGLPPVAYGGEFGNYTDQETHLLCLGHRYYDPTTGRFLNRDPIGYAGGENLYAYCGGNPVNEADPDGEWSLMKWAFTGNGDSSDQIYNIALKQAGKTLTDWDNSFSDRNLTAAGISESTVAAGAGAIPLIGSKKSNPLTNSRSYTSVARTSGFILKLLPMRVRKALGGKVLRRVLASDAKQIKYIVKAGEANPEVGGLLKAKVGLTLRYNAYGFIIYEVLPASQAARDAMDSQEVPDLPSNDTLPYEVVVSSVRRK